MRGTSRVDCPGCLDLHGKTCDQKQRQISVDHEHQNESNPLFKHSAVMNDTRQNKDASMIAFFIAGAFASWRIADTYTALFSILYEESLDSSD